MLNEEITFLLMMDSGRNPLEKRIVPLLVLREYVVPPSKLGVFAEIKDLKRLRDGFTLAER